MDACMHIDMRLILGAGMHLPGKVGGMEERKLLAAGLEGLGDMIRRS